MRDLERCPTTGGLVDTCRHCTEPEEATMPQLYPLRPFTLAEWDHLESVEERPAVEGTTDDDRPWLPLDGDQ